MAIGDIITEGGQAVADLFGSQGAAAAAQSYTGAAALASQNAQLAAASTRIQYTQTARTLSQTLGTQVADVAGAGFTESGSALDLLRSSQSQGALAESLVNIQGSINENSYAAQAGAYTAEAKAANEASQAGIVSAIGAIGGALVNNLGTLASAGKTVFQGAESLFSSAPDVGTAFSGASGATDAAQVTSFFNPADAAGNVDFAANLGGAPASLVGDTSSGLLAAPSGLIGSSTDVAFSSGADLSSAIGASDIGIDTSGVAIGATEDAVSTGITDAISSLGSDVVGGISDVVGSLGDLALGPAGLILTAASFIPGVGGVINDVVSGVTSAIGDVFSGIGSVFGSIICTALYKRGRVSRKVWFAAQRYGRDYTPNFMYEFYLIWGKPIADGINRSERFTNLVAWIFVPWTHELATVMGEETARSTWWSKTVYAITYAYTWPIGKLLSMWRKHATATPSCN